MRTGPRHYCSSSGAFHSFLTHFHYKAKLTETVAAFEPINTNKFLVFPDQVRTSRLFLHTITFRVIAAHQIAILVHELDCEDTLLLAITVRTLDFLD